ncbi:tyrosine-type recombinase/integrase [Candidatus Neomarinimicrobiota bacterium]
MSHKIAEFYKAAGISGANLHSLRKTFGSMHVQNNTADLYKVSKMLGHSSIKTTGTYYVDLVDEDYHEAALALDDHLPD